MPVSFVSKDHEKEWDKAKEIATERFGSQKHKSFWAFTNWMYHKLVGEPLSETWDHEKPIAKDKRVFPTSYYGCWKEMERYINRHPVYSTLSEDDKDELAHNWFTNNEDHTKYEVTKLNEFISTYGNATYGNNGLYGGVTPFGGGRDESPRGPIVYGFPEPGTPLNGSGGSGNYGSTVGSTISNGVGNVQDAGGPSGGDPAIVNIPPKESNYKPWETTLDKDGNVVSDIERKQVTQAETDAWNGPLGDVITSLEDNGLNVEEFNDMTEEQIEDAILRALKKEKSKHDSQNMNQNVNQIPGTIQNKLQEAFSWMSEEDMLDEAKREKGAIPKARDLLSSKFGVKNAKDKDENGRKYVLSRNEIEKIMRQKGLNYDPQSGRWLEKGGKDPEEKEDVVVDPESPAKDEKEDPDAPEFTKKVIPNDPNPLHNLEIIAKIKDYEARYLLGLAHDDQLAGTYITDPKTNEKLPQIDGASILAKLELLKYTWQPDKTIWLNHQLSLPPAVFANGEDRQFVSGRAILSAITNNPKWIQVNSDDSMPVEPKEYVAQELEKNGYTWDPNSLQWSWKPVTTPQTMNESFLAEANDNKKNVAIKQGQGRFLYDIDSVNNANDKEQIKDILNRASTKKTDEKNVAVDYPHVENYLDDKGFTFDRRFNMWVDRDGTFPASLEDLGETPESFIGRGILYANGDESAIAVENQKDSTKRAPRKREKSVIEDMQDHGYYFDENSGWKKKESIRTEDGREISEPQEVAEYKKQQQEKKQAEIAAKEQAKQLKLQQQQAKQAELDKAKAGQAQSQSEARLLDANYDLLSPQDKQAYDDMILKKSAMKSMGMQTWPTDEEQQKKAIKDFRKYHKQVIDPATGKKTWINRNSDMKKFVEPKSPFRRALSSIIKNTGRLGAAAGTGLGAALWNLARDNVHAAAYAVNPWNVAKNVQKPENLRAPHPKSDFN